ncbi:MAG TPA: sensor histidine kinase, partial [Chloroflexota bacterium]
MHWLGRMSLQTKVLLLQAGIVLLVVTVLSGTFIAILSGIVHREYEQRVMAVAQTVALMPALRDALAQPDPAAAIQPLAEQLRTAAGLTFIVISNRQGIRYSHPNPELIGKPVDEDDSRARAGQAYTTTEEGTLGVSIRAKVPILDDHGQVVGVVSAGILDAHMQQLLSSHFLDIGGVALGGLLLGLVVSFLLARHIKRQMFGLEPVEIAGLLEQREAMLHGIREG